jgi:aminoglycoside phosphotransferase (APT) family kinase protein
VARVLHDGAVSVLREVVLEVAHRHGLPISPVGQLRGVGSVNHVFCLGSGAERCVVRTPIDGLRNDEFEVEHWCLEQAAQQGIPSPRVLGRGDVSGTPYIVQTYVEGTAPNERDLTAWGTLGRYGRLAHGFVWTAGPDSLFTRFGRDPDNAWRQHLQYNADQLTGIDPLIGLGVYAASTQPRLHGVVSRLLDHKLTHGLRHGDLAPRNLLITPDGSRVLLDWGQASVGPVPHGDLLAAYRSHTVEGHPTATELDVFSDALGEPLAMLRPVLDDVLVLEALDRVRWALDNRPDRVADLVRDARTTVSTFASG